MPLNLSLSGLVDPALLVAPRGSVPDQAASLTGCCILVVEDEYLIATDMKRCLQAAGAEVLGPVPSVKRALDILKDRHPDAAALDVNVADGEQIYPVADRLAALNIPYLFCTGSVRATMLRAYSDRPALEKPFARTQLLSILSELVTSA